MIRTNSQCFFRRKTPGIVSFPLEGKHVVNEHHVVRKSHLMTSPFFFSFLVECVF